MFGLVIAFGAAVLVIWALAGPIAGVAALVLALVVAPFAYQTSWFD